MNLEGIIIYKTAYKERDLICKLLLRSGKLVTLYFYGGRGGGKAQKGSILEVGYMVKVTMAPRRKKLDQDILIAKEWKLLWESANIRANFQAFYLVSFFFEVAQKIAIDEDLKYLGEFEEEHQGIFNVLSNAIFNIDKSVKENNFQPHPQLFLFLIKLSYHLGIVPNYKSCQHCNVDLKTIDLVKFEPHNGGFTCYDCLIQKDESLSENRYLFEELKSSKQLVNFIEHSLGVNYKNYTDLLDISRGSCEAMFNYFCYQFHFQASQFKTWSFIIKS